MKDENAQTPAMGNDPRWADVMVARALLTSVLTYGEPSDQAALVASIETEDVRRVLFAFMSVVEHLLATASDDPEALEKLWRQICVYVDENSY